MADSITVHRKNTCSRVSSNIAVSSFLSLRIYILFEKIKFLVRIDELVLMLVLIHDFLDLACSSNISKV